MQARVDGELCRVRTLWLGAGRLGLALAAWLSPLGPGSRPPVQLAELAVAAGCTLVGNALLGPLTVRRCATWARRDPYRTGRYTSQSNVVGR